MKPIRFPKGCEMSIYLPLVLLTGGSKTAIEEGEVTNVAVSLSRYGVKTACTPTLFENFIVIQLPATLSAGAYVIEYTFKYDGRKVSGSIANVLEIVSDNAQSNWENYVSDGKAYLSDQIFVAGALLTDAEIAAKKAQYEAATAAANVAKASYEASKAAFDQKAENIDALGDMAKQTTLTAGITNIRADIAGIEVDVPSDVARESSPKYIENAVDELDTKVGNVQDGIGDIEDKISETVGSDPDGETVHAKLDSFAQELNKIGSPAEGQPSTLFEAIAEGGGGGGAQFYQYPVQQMTATTATLQPNVLYIWGEVSSLTITLATPTDNTIVNEYMMQFYSGTTPTVLTFSGDISVRGFVLNDSLISVSIINNQALVM